MDQNYRVCARAARGNPREDRGGGPASIGGRRGYLARYVRSGGGQIARIGMRGGDSCVEEGGNPDAQDRRPLAQENVSIMLALMSAALRAAIHSSVNFAESDGGLPFMNSLHAAISTSCRL